MGRCLGARPGRIDGRRAVQDVVVDPVLGELGDRLAAADPVAGWSRCHRTTGRRRGRRPACTCPASGARRSGWCPTARAGPAAAAAASCHQVLRNHSVGSRCSGAGSGPRLCAVTRISRSVGAGLGVLDLDVEVAVVVEHAGVEQFVLHLARGCARGWSPPGRRTGRPPAGTCTARAGRSGSGWRR